jgi:thymidine kinase
LHSSGTAGLDYGWITSHTGVMFGGKTEGLIRQVNDIKRFVEIQKNAAARDNQEDFPNLSIGTYKHVLDSRYSIENIVSHSGASLKAKPVTNIASLVDDIYLHDYRVVAIDEVQFFSEKDNDGNYLITYVLKQLADEDRLVIIAGLDKDFRGLPFGPMGDILAISDEKMTYTSRCAKCASPATLPQRFVNGQYPYFDDPVEMPGASEAYEPRCRKCHVVKRR